MLCTFPFLVGAPGPFFKQVFVTQAIRNGSGLPFLQRVADLTGIPGLTALTAAHRGIALCVLALLVSVGIAVVLICRRAPGQPAWSPLERLSIWGAVFVAAALLMSPTYYYHYSGFMAPFVALVASGIVVRLRDPLRRSLSRRSSFRPGLVGVLTSCVAVAFLLGAVVVEVLHAPAAPQVSDAVSDAIPVHGCVLYANPTLALLDNRFTSDVSGCPDVIDWLGQERVLDSGVTTPRSVSADKTLQGVMGRWIESSDAVVLETGNLGLSEANVDYLHTHFDCRLDVRKAVRVYVRTSTPSGDTRADESTPPLADRCLQSQ